MLIQLKLKNIALIEIIEINFEKGLNIITGDSGSGKSLILDSLNVLFGGTNIPLNHLIRPEKEYCLIEAKFSSCPRVNLWLIKNRFQKPLSDIIIKRKTYKKNNKILTKYTINDRPIKKTLLEELGPILVDFAGQSESFLFDSQEYRRSVIDDLGCKESRSINAQVKNLWKKCETFKSFLLEKKETLKNQEKENLALKEMFNILEQANLNSSDEISELESQENRLANKLEINNAIHATLKNLNNFSEEDQSASFLIGQSIKNINKIVQFDIKFESIRDILLSIQNDIENLIAELNLYLNENENNNINLEDTQKRLFFLKNLERIFLLDLPQLIQKRDQLKKNMSINTLDEEVQDLEIQIRTLQSNLNSLFITQSSQRKKIANKLEVSVMSILANLGLKNAKFLVEFKEVNPSVDGIEDINFLFSANPDQKLAPLSKVISGGEMSRFLLAIKSTISRQPNTFFLDEIDNGLSGKSLFALVELIKAIALEKQVICITHQPFLAAAAKAHFKVNKDLRKGLTFTSIKQLTTKKERQNEIVELIGGGFGEANDYASILLEKAAA